MTFARFSIDANAFSVADPSTEARTTFEHFLKFWRDYGIFVSLLSATKIPLRDMLPADMRKMYVEVQKSLLYTSRRVEDVNLSFDVVRSDLLNKTYHALDNLDLRVIGVLDDLIEEIWGSGKREKSFYPRRREEVCRIHHLLFSDTVKALEEQRDSDVPKHMLPERVWSEKLEPTFATSGLISVVDPYALVDLTNEADPQNSGLGFLIRKVASEGHRYGDVEIITSFLGLGPRKKEVPDLETRALAKVKDFCAREKVRKLSIYVAAKPVAENLLHDRFIVGDDHSIDIGRGLYILGQAPRHQTTTFGLKRMTDSRTRLLHQIRSARRGMRSVIRS